MKQLRITWSALALLCAGTLAHALPPLPGGGTDAGASGAIKRTPAEPGVSVHALPAGSYTLRLTLNQQAIEESVVIAHNGSTVSATVQGGEVLSGSINPSGQLTLMGSSGATEISLSASVSNGHAMGTAQLKQGGTRKTGSFSLDPVAAVTARELPVYVPKTTPPPPEPCGFFCKLGKCLSDWSKC